MAKNKKHTLLPSNASDIKTYTEIDKTQYPKTEFREHLSDDITLFELRVDQKKRVHGFRHESIFYIFWLDKNHSLLN